MSETTGNKGLTRIFHISILLGFLLLLLMLARLQVFQGETFAQIAENNYVRLLRVPATRGEIFDRDYQPLALNQPSINLMFVPGKIRNKEAMADFVSDRFDVSRENVLDIIYKNRFRSYNEIRLVKDVAYEDFVDASEYLNYYPSLFFRTENSRRYLLENHFTGYMGKIGEKEYESLKDRDYSIDDNIGKNGIEKQYEEILRGAPGYRVLQVDARGRNLHFLTHNLEKESLPGLQMILTIDSELQKEITQTLPKDARAAVVVMDVRNGDILSYISTPEYDPNIFMSRISAEDWDALINDPARPLMDRIIHGTYPPGSVYKPLVASLALEREVIEPDEKLAFCDGGYWVGNRYFRCWNEWGHGRLNVVDALTQSCDVYFYDLSNRLELDDLRSFTIQNHLIDPTGVDIGQERAGFFPSEEWYVDHYGRYVSIKGMKVNLSIGQGEILCSPLQVCCYFAALATDGVWHQPHLLKKLIGENADRYDIPHVEKTLPLSEDTKSIIRRSLYKVVNHSTGTGKTASHPVAKVYGKTGSAENHLGKTTHAWFAGWAEWQNPEIAIVVFMENAGHGGSFAAPVAGKIVRYYHDKYHAEP